MAQDEFAIIERYFSAIGKITDTVIEDNTKSWSGDHSIDPDLVPGVFFSNWKLEEKKPSLEDLAPTILSLFGAGPQPFHDGRPLTMKNPKNDRSKEIQ